MCGIVGSLNLAVAEPPVETILRGMLGQIRHRGPDEFGLYLGDEVGLGSARLSIVDLSGGQQPIGNEDGTLWIVFNGEIFNYVELRAELETRGHCFTTYSDTEVILHLFEDLGPKAFERLNGQWAVAIWNTRRKELVLSRDRLGVRPLFYWRSAERLVFGSEIKALMAHTAVETRIDPAGLEQVFTYWGVPGPGTVFQGVRQVQPGHSLVASREGFKETSYWQLDFGDAEDRPLVGHDGRPGAVTSGEVEQQAEALRELLLDATRVRLRADVPVGAYLSGGLDSSIIAAAIRRLALSRLDTFSIAFHDQHFDESEFQQQMSRALGTEHQVIRVTHGDVGQVFPEVIWHTETPLMRTAPAPMFLLSRLVHERGYKVVLTGEGADEFLAGYDIFKEAKIRRFWARQPQSKSRSRLLSRIYPDIQGLGGTGDAYLKAFFGRGLSEVDRPDYSHMLRWANNRRCCRFLSPELLSEVNQRRSGEFELIPPSGFKRWGPLEQAQYWEITVFLSSYLLSSQGDRVAMANSVEGRYPFLDYRMVEFCCRLPSRFKLRGLTEKFLLRKAFAEWLPPEIGSRPKRPYRAPIRNCFIGKQGPEYVEEMLSEAALRRTGFFNVNAVRQLFGKLKENKSSSETDDMALVGILSTQLLQEQFRDRVRAGKGLVERDRVKVVDRRTKAQP